MFMEIAALGLRMAATSQGAAYLPFAFEGDFTDEEKALIESAITPHVPPQVDSMFNNWNFTKRQFDKRFVCRRSTWDRLSGFDSAEEMADFIHNYYTK